MLLGMSKQTRQAGQGLEAPFALFKPCGSQCGELGRFDPSSLGVGALAIFGGGLALLSTFSLGTGVSTMLVRFL